MLVDRSALNSKIFMVLTLKCVLSNRHFFSNWTITIYHVDYRDIACFFNIEVHYGFC